MGTTANRAYPYPESTDPPAGHTQIEALADAVDADVAGLPILQAKKSIIAAEQSRNSTDWGYLGTNDKVTGIVLSADGLICVSYRAWFKSSVGSDGQVAIFLNGTEQLNNLPQGVSWEPQSAFTPAEADRYGFVTTTEGGLTTITPNDVPDADIVTPAALAGITYIEAPAGTYEVGVKFNRTSGSVYAKERKLRVWAQSFA